MDEKLYKPFCISVGEIIKEMSDIDVVGMDSLEEERHELTSMGVSSIITFAGARKGRLLLDMEPGLALSMAGAVLGEEYGDVRIPWSCPWWLSEQYHIGERHHRNQQRVAYGPAAGPPVVSRAGMW